MAAIVDIGCNNKECVKAPKCERTEIYKNGTAREIKHFGGSVNKGCGKFIHKKDD